MSPHRVVRLASTALFVLVTLSGTARAETSFTEVESLGAPTNAVQIAYAPAHGRLVIRNASSAVAVLDLCAGGAQTRLSHTKFNDMSISPDGRYLYVADYGGENIGYGTPSNQHYVHRLDLRTGVWEEKKAYLAAQVQPISAERFILKSLDQWVDFSLNEWGSGDAITEIVPNTFTYCYFGDFRYDFRTARLLHGNSGLSSNEIRAYKVSDAGFVDQETSGTYGNAQGYGPNVALATDGSVFYYGTLAVDALDVTHNLHVYPEPIYAATADVAFGKASYYDAHTASALGSLGFDSTAYGLNANGTDFWTFDAASNKLKHFVAGDAGSSAVDCSGRDAGPEFPDASGDSAAEDASTDADAGDQDAASEPDASAQDAASLDAADVDADASVVADAASSDASLSDASLSDASLSDVESHSPQNEDGSPRSDSGDPTQSPNVPPADTASCDCSLVHETTRSAWPPIINAAIVAAALLRRRARRASSIRNA